METVEELKAQIAVLQEAAKHVRIHHADDMATMRARSTRAITEAVGSLQNSLVALSRGHHKMHIVKVLVTDAIHDLTDHMEKLAPQPRPKKQMEVDFSRETGKSAILKSLGLQEGYSVVDVDATDTDLIASAWVMDEQWNKR